MSKYTENEIKSLDWKEHIRLRPGMYIGKLGNGDSPDDGIYVLVKEIVDNSIDEHVMGFGKKLNIQIENQKVIIRDYGRGIPLGKVVDCVSKINTGGKYDSAAFQKSVGLNGVGTKAVNALSKHFMVQSFREGKSKKATFSRGKLIKEEALECNEPNGTCIEFEADESIFKKHKYISEFVVSQLWNYAYLNAGLAIHFNGKTLVSKNGLLDLLEKKAQNKHLRYPIIHLKDEDIEIAFSHNDHYGEDYFSFVNGQYTTQGGTHLSAFKEALVRTIREHFNKNFEPTDIRQSIMAAVSIRVMEPVFESQTKTKLGSTEMGGTKPTIRTFLNDFLKTNFDNYLHRNPEISKLLLARIQQSEKERKEIAGVKKLAKEKAKKASLHNKKLRDCRVHLGNVKTENRFESTLFITEGDSASGSITKARDVETQAVFSLKGKPLNCFGLKKKTVYENEEFNLLQHALNIEESIENLRYNKIVIATDADVDGMHIRLLMMTFFLQFFPDVVRDGHLYILETPLFRVRNKKITFYCYTEKEKLDAISECNQGNNKAEITRFKGLGEISPDEFKAFIGEDIRLSPVILEANTSIDQLLSYFMGKNTPDRQKFIIENLKIEKDELKDALV